MPPIVSAVKRGGPLRLYRSIPPQCELAPAVTQVGPLAGEHNSSFKLERNDSLLRAKGILGLHFWATSVAASACKYPEDRIEDLMTWMIPLYDVLQGQHITGGIELLAIYGRRDSSTEFNDLVGQLAASMKSKDVCEEDEAMAELRIIFVRAVVSQVEKNYRIWRRLWPEAGRKDELGKLD
ncbi:hypothetical protein LTR56_016198 [Elasticomyces elasticus]|nr:hypothetical protein LTR56_016198 [Elasticomyces elasticus]KAK3642157.1 hypothetical protein LTR22_016278 [Elasticomyces elasticus]KAK4914205.1 hypothetical protein LTR49_017558 [Elasticomyces elasticus]KAK5762566.1 hypothetical protein LTS12_007357 [Elasticomyces elasticus]